MGLVNSIPSKKYIRSVGLFLALLHAPQTAVTLLVPSPPV
jgi:hypothetical protein